MLERPNHEGEADDSVHGDHHGGEHSVACERLRAGPSSTDKGDDQSDLDRRDRNCKDQGAVRLAHAMSDDFCVIHRDEHSSGKHDGDQDDQPAIEFLAPERRERDAGNNRDAGTHPGLIRGRLGRVGLTGHDLVSVGIG